MGARLRPKYIPNMGKLEPCLVSRGFKGRKSVLPCNCSVFDASMKSAGLLLLILERVLGGVGFFNALQTT